MAVLLKDDLEAILLDADLQNFFGVVMREKGLLTGIGSMSGDDVRQHLQHTAWRALQRFDGSVKPITYLYMRIRGEADSLIRSFGTRDRNGDTRPQEMPIEDAPLPSADGIDALTEDIGLKDVIGALPWHYRQTLYLRYYESLTVAEAAERMAITVGMICRYEHAAIVQMRLLLSGR